MTGSRMLQLSGSMLVSGGRLRRLAAFAVVIILVSVGAVYMFGHDRMSDSHLWSIPTMNSTPGGDRQRESRQYQATVMEANDQNLQVAHQDGLSHLPIPESVPESVQTDVSSGILPWMESVDMIPPENADENPSTESAIGDQSLSTSDDVPESAAAPKSGLDELLGITTGGIAPESSDQDVVTGLEIATARSEFPPLRDGSFSQSDSFGIVGSRHFERQQQHHDDILAQMSTIAAGMAVGPMAGRVLIAANAGETGEKAGSGSTGQEHVHRPAYRIHAGDILYGSVIIGAESENNLPVVAQIDSGELEGFRLVGSFSISGNNDGMLLSFDTLIDLNGSEYPTRAYAIDGYTGSGSVISRLDQRVMARYGPIMAASFITGLAQSAATPRTIILNSFGNQTVVQEEPAMRNSIYAGIAAASGQVREDLLNSAPRGPRIMIDAGHPIGILFLESVLRTSG